VVGIAFSLLVPVSIPNARATDLVRGVARSQASLLNELALSLASRTPHPEEVKAWFDWTEDIAQDIDAASAAVQAVEDSRRLNPRALATAKVHPGLRGAIDRLDRCLIAVRALLVVISEEAPTDTADSGRPSGSELRRAFAVVLDDLANALRAFGDLVKAEYDGGNVERVEAGLDRTLDIVRETRAVLTELVLLDVDPRNETDQWMLQGSVLTAIEQVLQELDLELTERSEAWLDRHPLLTLPIGDWLSLSRQGESRRRKRRRRRRH
jgi:hypothetical protein